MHDYEAPWTSSDDVCVGIWCDDCLTPGAIESDVCLELGNGTRLFGTYRRCLRCREDERDAAA